MRIFTKLYTFLFGLAAALFLVGCSSTGGSDGSSVVYHQTVYGGYGYPYSYGCCYDSGSDVIVVRPEKPEEPDQPNRPVRPRPPSTQPVRPSRPIGRPVGSRPSVGMGRPSGARATRRR